MSRMYPQINLFSDGHVHCRLCHHAEGEMEEYVVAAIDKSLKEIVFLEHMEEGIEYFKTSWLTEQDFDYYFSEGERLRGKYQKHIRIGIGVEVGFNPSGADELSHRLVRRHWDRVGISNHYLHVAGNSQHLNLLGYTVENRERALAVGTDFILEQYFTNLRSAVLALPGTVLCHLDAALRYVENLSFTQHHFALIDDLLLAVKHKGMAIEINTSGIPGRGEPFPSRQLLKRALHFQIPLLAGSDAHSPKDVGRHFDMLEDYISSALSS